MKSEDPTDAQARARLASKLPRRLFVALAIVTPALAFAYDQGEVAVGEGKCQKRDRVVIATASGFVLAEQYSGSFDRGDQVVGELSGYGTKDVLVNDRAGRIWIDDYMVSQDKAKRWCFGV